MFFGGHVPRFDQPDALGGQRLRQRQGFGMGDDVLGVGSVRIRESNIARSRKGRHLDELTVLEDDAAGKIRIVFNAGRLGDGRGEGNRAERSVAAADRVHGL